MISPAPPAQAPRWVTLVLVPVANLAVAFIIAGIIIALIGEDPWQAMKLLVLGAFGATDLIGFTLYYTTNFIFTGLAVAIAFHCGLFNIGGTSGKIIGEGRTSPKRTTQSSPCTTWPRTTRCSWGIS